jgi:hypothetical protein
MARPLRIDYADAYYHVTCRGVSEAGVVRFSFVLNTGKVRDEPSPRPTRREHTFAYHLLVGCELMAQLERYPALCVKCVA